MSGLVLVFRSRYTFDLNVKEGHEGYHTLMKCSTPIGYKELRQVEDTMKKQGLIVPPIMIFIRVVVLAVQQVAVVVKVNHPLHNNNTVQQPLLDRY